jgi:hypothetical protein
LKKIELSKFTKTTRRKPVIILRHRPSILPILSVWSKERKTHQGAVKVFLRQREKKKKK